MANYRADTLYKIGATSTNMATLKQLGIAPPDQVTYQAASTYYVRSDMSRVGDGFSLCSWVWDNISIQKLSTLLAFLGGNSWADVFINTDIRDGTYPNPAKAFKLYSARMWKPLLFGQEGQPVNRTPYVIQTVHIQFVNLVLVS